MFSAMFMRVGSYSTMSPVRSQSHWPSNSGSVRSSSVTVISQVRLLTSLKICMSSFTTLRPAIFLSASSSNEMYSTEQIEAQSFFCVCTRPPCLTMICFTVSYTASRSVFSSFSRHPSSWSAVSASFFFLPLHS